MGPKNWRGPGHGSVERGDEDEDEDADENADQENEEEEVTEQEEKVVEEEAVAAVGGEGERRAKRLVVRGGVSRGDPRNTGGRGCRPSRDVSPANVVARSGGRVTPSFRAARFL